ncbi:MAG: hypothetical protein IK024_04980 [Treponema sp.]|nr:hypothetical protein [Treponema sp.]
MVKKILFGLVAVAAVLSLASCGIKKDDPEGIIKGTAGNYSVNYKYENADTTATYRAYKSTTYPHAGGLVKVTFNEADLNNAGSSKFGVIFGYKEETKNSQRLRDFYIVGLGANGDYYVSKFENVVDIQAENFGAKTNPVNEGDPKEIMITTGGAQNNGILNSGSLYEDTEGNKYAYIWFQAFSNGSAKGSYKIKIGNMTDTAADNWEKLSDDNKRSTPPAFDTELYTKEITEAFDACTAGQEPQLYTGVYARVQGTKTLNGKVNFKGDYLEAEDIEPID